MLRSGRYFGFGLLLVLLLFGFVACDVTKLMGSEDDDDSGSASASEEATAAISSFTFSPTDNPFLDEEYSSLIAENGDITAFLPADIVASGTELEARATLPRGATISPDPRTPRSYASPVEYVVTSYDESATKSFVVRPQSRAAAVSARVLDFSFDTTGENDELVSPISAEVSGTTLFLALPYQLMQQDELILEPSVVVSDSASYSPAGPIDFKSQSIFTVTGADGAATIYSINTTIDPDTLTFLDLSDPFYVDGSNVRTAFTDDGINFQSGQQVVTVKPNVWDVVDGKHVGFFTREAPYNGSVDVDPLVLGAVPPYTVRVTSANGEWFEDHEVTLDRITPSASGIQQARVNVTGAFRRYWRRTSGAVRVEGKISIYWEPSSWTSPASSVVVAREVCEVYWAHGPCKDYGWEFNTVPTGAANSYATAASYWMSNTTESGSQWRDMTVSPASGLVTWTHSSYSFPDKPDETGTTTTSWYMTKPDGKAQGRRSYRIEYTPSFSRINSMEIILDDYAWVENLLEGPLSLGYTTSFDGPAQIITFNLLSTADAAAVGEVAKFDVVAESGDRQTYTININN